MARPETIKALCEMPVEHWNNRRTMSDLLQASGYFEEPTPPTEEEYAAHIRTHPELVHAWYQFSGDQRCTSGWVLCKPGDEGNTSWLIYHFPEGHFSYYEDGITASGAYAARNVARLVELIRDREEREKNKGRKGRKARRQHKEQIETKNSDPTIVFRKVG